MGTQSGKHLASNWHFAKRLEELEGFLLSRPLRDFHENMSKPGRPWLFAFSIRRPDSSAASKMEFTTALYLLRLKVAVLPISV